MLSIQIQFSKLKMVLSVSFLLLGVGIGFAADFDNSWQTGFYANGLDGKVNTIIDHEGQRIIGGSFSHAAELPASNIVSWDPQTGEFSALADGLDGYVRALTSFEGDLIAAGFFQFSGSTPVQHVARWDGSQWTPLGEGLNDILYDLEVFEDQLFADQFRWTGSEWVEEIPTNGSVTCLASWNGQLILGGGFTEALGVAVNRICSWDGQIVSPLADGLNDEVQELLVYEGDLVAGGRFTASAGTELQSLGTWDGSNWTNIELGMDPYFMGSVSALADYQGDLVVCINISNGFIGSTHLLRQIPAGWETLTDLNDGYAEGLYVDGDDLMIGGRFSGSQDIPAANIALYSGDQFEAMVSGGLGFNSTLSSLCTFQGQVVVGGYFQFAGSTLSTAAATWDGSGWIGMSDIILDGIPVDPIPYSQFDKLATDNNILVGGLTFVGGCLEERYVCRWDSQNATWVSLVYGYDDLAVLAGQIYGTRNSEPGVHQVIDNEWVQVPGDFGYGVTCLSTWNGMLIAGGYFSQVDDLTANGIAAWTGDNWISLGEGLPGAVETIGLFDNSLVVAYYLDGQRFVGMFDGFEWQTLGGSFSSRVNTLQQFGTHLFAGGHFNSVDGVPMTGLSWWNGFTWNAYGNTGSRVNDLAVNAGKLYVAGEFRQMGSVASARFACLPEPLSPVASSDDFPMAGLSLGPNAPNPFNPMTTFHFNLPAAGPIQLEVFDMRGRLVDTVAQGYFSAGDQSVVWNGKDAQNGTVASGAYFVRLSDVSRTVSRKIMLVR